MILRQHPDPPKTPRPIVLIGAGSIVRHAHLPAYRMCGFEVVSVFDPRHDVAQHLARDFGIPFVAETLQELVDRAPSASVFDLAVPASAILGCLELMPLDANLLIQKPMGETLDEAIAILGACGPPDSRRKAAVNFQLRYAPYVLAARHAIEIGLIGEILEIDVKVNVHTPWADWDFLEKSPRMEIVYHSIHYLDLIRSFLGEPNAVKCNTIRHPDSPKLHSSRSAILLDYGECCRAQVVTYHAHKWGPRHQQSSVTIEGTRGCIRFQMGLNMDYPRGVEDYLEINSGSGWETVELEGSWFPHAFRGTMSSVMRWAEDSALLAPTHVGDAIKTMALVEGCYVDATKTGTEVPEFL